MGIIVKLDEGLFSGRVQTGDRTALCYGGRKATYRQLNGEARAVCEQLRKASAKEGTNLFVYMEHIYLTALTVLAADMLGCNVILCLKEKLALTEKTELPENFLIAADQRYYVDVENLSVNSVMLTLPEAEEAESVTTKPDYRRELSFSSYDINGEENIVLSEEKESIDIHDFMKQCGITENSRLCLNGCRDCKAFLLEMLSAFMTGAVITYYEKYIDYNPVVYFQRLMQEQCDIVNVTPFNLSHLYQLKEELPAGIPMLFEGIHTFLLLKNPEESRDITGFIKAYEDRSVFLSSEDTHRDKNVFYTGDRSKLNEIENYIFELIYMQLRLLTKAESIDLDLTEELELWGFNSINYVEIIVLLEGILYMEFDDEMLDHSNFESMFSLVEGVAGQWAASWKH